MPHLRFQPEGNLFGVLLCSRLGHVQVGLIQRQRLYQVGGPAEYLHHLTRHATVEVESRRHDDCMGTPVDGGAHGHG